MADLRIETAGSVPERSDSGGRAWVRWGLAALGAAGSLAVLVGAASYSLSGLLIRPRQKRLAHLQRLRLRRFLSRLGVQIEDITIPSFDGIRLRGWWIESSRDAPTIVALHGVSKNRTDMMRVALLLNGAGFNVLILDGRAHGHSEGRYVTYGFHEQHDVRSAIDWLIAQKGIDGERIGLVGESMGAAIALQAAARDKRIRAVWADSPFASLLRVTQEYVSRLTRLPVPVLSPLLWTTVKMANYRGNFEAETVEPARLAAKVTCPVFIVHGTADQLIDPEHSRNIYEALGGEKQIWLVEGAAHARAAHRAKRQYGERLLAFFTKYLKGQLPHS
jgi:dipeptidyl aminopeptidase/acylaminoacyl peptidase